MNDNMHTVAVIAALAIYKTKGVTFALTYLIKAGLTFEEALDVFAQYDRFEDMSKAGVL